MELNYNVSFLLNEMSNQHSIYIAGIISKLPLFMQIIHSKSYYWNYLLPINEINDLVHVSKSLEDKEMINNKKSEYSVLITDENVYYYDIIDSQFIEPEQQSNVHNDTVIQGCLLTNMRPDPEPKFYKKKKNNKKQYNNTPRQNKAQIKFKRHIRINIQQPKK